jgi:hypothetical protein
MCRKQAWGNSYSVVIDMEGGTSCARTLYILAAVPKGTWECGECILQSQKYAASKDEEGAKIKIEWRWQGLAAA